MASSDDPNATGGEPGRRRRQTSSLLVLAGGLLLFAAAAGAFYLASRPTILRIAVGPQGSDDYKVIQAMGQTFARDGSAVRLALIVTAGPADSAALLGASKTDLAVARADLDMPRGARVIAILRKNFVVLWSAPGLTAKGGRKTSAAKIKSIAALAGHRVGVVGRTDANVTLLRVILKESGVDPDKVAVTKFGTEQAAEMARDPAIDAFMTVGPLDAKITSDAIATTTRIRGEPAFLPIDVSEEIAQKFPLYGSEEIPGSIFSSKPARPDDKVETVGVNHLIVAPKTLRDTVAGALTRQVFDIRQALIRDQPSAAKIEKPDTDKDAALPAHPGAAAYIDGTERTFLEQYSDYVWATLFLLSLVGSGTAWLRHHLKRNERAENALHRDKLVATIAKVRQAQTPDELAAMQCEADGLLRETLDCHDDGALEDGDLSAFALVLEQFRHAVIDRRAALDAAAPDAADASDPPRMLYRRRAAGGPAQADDGG
jgi:TRAP transporter TAXI family solute receptor